MKSFFISAFAAAVILISLGPANAQIAGTFEPFTHEANAQSWLVFDYSDGEYYFPAWLSQGDEFNSEIYFTFTGTSTLEFLADEFSSDGAFVGDLAAGGVDAIGCDVYVEDINSFNFAEFYMFSETDGRYYYSDFIDPGTSGWDFAYASLIEDDWYVYENEEFVPVQLTPEILSGITEVGVTFYPLAGSASDGKTVGIDNFTFYGALVLPEINTSAAGGLFKLEIEDFLTPVPDVGP